MHLRLGVIWLHVGFILAKEEEMRQMGGTPAWIGKGIVVAYA